MKLDKDTHKKIMLKVLSDISTDAFLVNSLGFKGGTACYFLYGLDRFSVDLDFDSLHQANDELVKKRLLELLQKYGNVKTKTSIKLKYSDQYQALKIDLSFRHNINQRNSYEVRDIVSGVALKVLRKEDIFAHKLIALTSRGSENAAENNVIANRDLYDINFFFKKMWSFNEEIIQLHTNQTMKEYLEYAIGFIDKNVNEMNILDRLGELVSDEKREWVQKNLKKAVMRELAIQAEAMREY